MGSYYSEPEVHLLSLESGISMERLKKGLRDAGVELYCDDDIYKNQKRRKERYQKLRKVYDAK